MKKLLLFLLLIPTLAFTQVSSWRSNPPSRVQSGPSIQGQRSDISGWRNTSPREFNRPQQTRPGSNIVISDPWFYDNWGWGWGWNRWNMWGAPAFGWSYWNPYFYYNDWGYRQPARIYVYEDGRKDTIKGVKPVINFGLSKTNDEQIGGFFAIGNRSYFIMDFVTTYEKDNSTFFPYGTITKVDFPLISDLRKNAAIYLGGGKRFGRTGVHAMIGFGKEIIRYRGKDKLGEITFPKYNRDYSTIKVGVLQDFKNFTLKVDSDPIRNYWQVGLGLNL